MAKLGEVFTLQMGKTPARAREDYWNTGDNAWVSISDISACGKYVGKTKETISDLAVRESGIKIVPADTVIMSFKLTLGKTAITVDPIYTNEAIMAFIPNGSYPIHTGYLYHFCSGRDWTAGTNRAVMGTTLNKATISEIEVEIPPLSEQIDIANRLDDIDALIIARREQLAKLDELVKSRFIEMFGAGKYPIVKAADVCDFITKGTTPPTGEITEKYEIGLIPYLKVYNLSFTGELLFDSMPQYIPVETHNKQLARSKVVPNDVLMNIVGPPLGKFSLVTDEFSEWNINQAIAIFRAKDRVLPRYLLAALMQPEVLRPFLEQAVGIRQLNLSLEQCRNLEFPLPPIEEQKAFVSFSEQTDKSKFEIQQSLEKLETLKKNLMQQYFG